MNDTSRNALERQQSGCQTSPQPPPRPRPLRQTLDVVIGYGIQIETEANYLWLADLAIALPLPAGWVQVDHPTQQAQFWHNEICQSSQWQHPVDDFVKATIKMQRQPSSPHSSP